MITDQLSEILNTGLVCVYVVALLLSVRRPVFALTGLVAILAANCVSAWMESNSSAMIEAYGFDGYSLRWNGAMATIDFLWFLSIQHTHRLSILLPVGGIMVLDVLLLLASHIDLTRFDSFIVALTVALHLIYCWGCINGSRVPVVHPVRSGSHAGHHKNHGGGK